AYDASLLTASSICGRRDPQPVPRARAREGAGVPTADCDRNGSVRVLVGDQLAARRIRERAGDEGEVTVERQPQLDAVACSEAHGFEVLTAEVELNVAKTVNS